MKLTSPKTYVTLFGTIFILSVIIFYFIVKFSGSKENTTFILSSTKDFFQLLFFATVITVTILSYIQAKKTLFQPIKTETFKIQIKSFEEILAFFQNKSTTDFTKLFDLDKILEYNAQIMFRDFVECFYSKEIKFNEERFKELYKIFKGGVVSAEYAQKHFQSVELFEKPLEKVKEEITNPAILLNKWKNYEFGMINITEAYYEEQEKLNNLIASPLIPSQLKELLTDFDNKLKENVFFVGKTLTLVAQELPNKIPNVDAVKTFNGSGVWNRYNDNDIDLEPTAKKILEFITDYLKIEELTKE